MQRGGGQKSGERRAKEKVAMAAELAACLYACEGGVGRKMEIRWMNSDVNRPSGVDEGRRRR